MAMPAAFSRRLQKLEAAMPVLPAGSRHWLELFAGADFHFRLSEREPDFAGAYAAYAKLTPPYGEAEERLYGHLCELFGRAYYGVPPCSVTEFTELAAWLEAYGDGLPTTGGWAKELEVGDGKRVTLCSLRWQVGLGPTADGSGKVAETIRRLRAKQGNAIR